MSLESDSVELLLIVGAVAGAIYYAKKKAGSLIPQKVKDGADAAWQLAGLGKDMVLDPINIWGVAPGTFSDGTPKWTPTAPQNNPDDAVSNGAGGMNFNLF